MGHHCNHIIEVNNRESIGIHLNTSRVFDPTIPKYRYLYIVTIVYFPYIIYVTIASGTFACPLIQGLNADTTILGYALLVLCGSIK